MKQLQKQITRKPRTPEDIIDIPSRPDEDELLALADLAIQHIDGELND